MFTKIRRHIEYRFWKLEGRFRSLLLIFLIVSIYFVLLYKREHPGMTPLMGIRFVEQIREGRPIILKYTRVPIQEISDYVIYGVMAAEDQKFVEHFGFDFDAILNAMEYNIKTDSMSI